MKDNPLKTVIEALEDAIELITGEYCSHATEPCRASTERCYARNQYQALKELNTYITRIQSEEIIDEMSKAYLNHTIESDPDLSVYGRVGCGMKSVLNVIKGDVDNV